MAVRAASAPWARAGRAAAARTPVAKVSRHAESRDAMLAPGWRPDHPHARSGADARRVGATFRTRGISLGRVLSSPWCRCLETARLAFGRAEVWPPLSNLYDNRAHEAEQMRALKEIAGRRPAGGNLLLVTHGSVVLPLTGIQPAPAELVVLTPEGPDRFRVAGRLTP